MKMLKPNSTLRMAATTITSGVKVIIKTLPIYVTKHMFFPCWIVWKAGVWTDGGSGSVNKVIEPTDIRKKAANKNPEAIAFIVIGLKKRGSRITLSAFSVGYLTETL